MSYFKKILAAFLISILLFNTGTLAYEDIPDDSPYFYAVEFLKRNKAVSDTKFFKPDTLISKAEFIKVLVIINSPEFKFEKTAELPFEDTQNSAWYASYFKEALALGILSETEKKVFPYKKLTIPESLELLFRSKSIPIPRKHVGEILFKDVKDHAKAPLIMKALERGVVDPESDDRFGVNRKLSRGEAASMIYRLELFETGAPAVTPLRGDDSKGETDDFYLQKIITSWDTIQKNYVYPKKLDSEKMSDAAVKAMFEALGDPYSVYLDQAENTAFSSDLEGEVEGIGAMIELNKEGEVVIVAPLADSPAMKAGLKAGDIIEKADEKELKGLLLPEAASLIKGPKGTSVTLTIRRNGTLKTFNVVRALVKVNALTYERRENNNIMYIRLMQFSQNAGGEFKKVVDEIKKDSVTKGVILDLRDNPGGLLDSSLEILNYFLKKGSTAVKIRYSSFNYTQYATGNGELSAYPIVVLINKGSASASEIVAGALKDYDLATLIGETSFGKGTVQELNFFRDNSSIKLTVAEWLTPLGKSIQDNGIKPDIEIKLQEGEGDEQLDRAIEELKGKF